jgi:hypothetical protein
MRATSCTPHEPSMTPATPLAASSSAARPARPGRLVRVGPRALLGAAGPLLVLLAALALAIAPAWSPVWYQDDQLPTLFRTFHTDLAHHWGVLYPRLAPELGFGYGRLLHELYPPFGVELAAWLHTLGLGFVDAARATFSLCLLSSGLGMYAFARSFLGGRWPAVVAAIGFAWAPYVLLDAHKGGVLGESIALALMPWSLLALDRLARGGGWAAFGASAGVLALVILGHNITALFFVGLASAYAGLAALRPDSQTTAMAASETGAADGTSASLSAAPPIRERLRRLARAAGAVVLALALSALYWLPALLEQKLSRVSEQRTGDFTVTRYLLAPRDLLQPSAIFDYYVEAVPRYGLAAAVLTILALGLVAAACLRSARAPAPSDEPGRALLANRLLLGAFGLCFVVVLALQLRATAPIWDTLPLISFVQFPQRLFVFGAFAGAVVLGAAPIAARLLSGRRALGVAAGALVVAALGASSLPGIYWTWPVAGSHVIDEDQVGIGTAAERRLSERRAFDDYFPIWVEEDSGQITRPASPSRVDTYRAASPGPAPRVTLVERGYLGLTARTEADAPSALIVHQFYFPGWQATADGAPLAVGPAGPLGLVMLTVPAGRHTVEVWFGETPVRDAGLAGSGAALLVLLAALTLGLGWRRVLVGSALVAIVVLVPRLVHNAVDPPDRPPVQVVNVDVTPSARVAALERDDRPARPGEVVPITLIWESVAYTPRDLQSGLRLLPADGNRVLAERWGRPNRERTPTGKWLAGELIPDTLLLRIPSDLKPGRYRLQAGLRDPDASDRAPLGLADVGEIEVR